MTPAMLINRSLGEPTLLPVWPKSDKIVLICVECANNDKRVIMSVLNSESDLEAKLREDDDVRRLYFNILKSDLALHKI